MQIQCHLCTFNHPSYCPTLTGGDVPGGRQNASCLDSGCTKEGAGAEGTGLSFWSLQDHSGCLDVLSQKLHTNRKGPSQNPRKLPLATGRCVCDLGLLWGWTRQSTDSEWWGGSQMDAQPWSHREEVCPRLWKPWWTKLLGWPEKLVINLPPLTVLAGVLDHPSASLPPGAPVGTGGLPWTELRGEHPSFLLHFPGRRNRLNGKEGRESGKRRGSKWSDVQKDQRYPEERRALLSRAWGVSTKEPPRRDAESRREHLLSWGLGREHFRKGWVGRSRLPWWLRGKGPACPVGATEMRGPSRGREDPLEEETAIHSGILAWEIPWTEEPGGLRSTELQRVWQDWVTEPLPPGRGGRSLIKQSFCDGSVSFSSSWGVCIYASKAGQHK